MACIEFLNWVGEIGVVEVARKVSDHTDSTVPYQAIQGWVKGDIPPARVLTVEAVSGISRHALNPVIYPNEAA